MATTNLVFSPTYATIDDIVLDCSVSETHSGEVDVTEHEVEEGSPITDHARPKPVTLSMEGIISNTPISREQSLRAVESNGISFQTSTQNTQVRAAPGYAEQAFAKLELLRTQTKLITVITALKTYENMILSSLNVPRNAQTGEAVRFTAVFKQVRLVKNQTTEVKITKTTQGKKNVPLGPQTNKPETPAQEARIKTPLLELGEGFVSLFH